MQHVRARQYGNVVRKRVWCALQVEVRGEWVSEWVGECVCVWVNEWVSE